MKDTVIIIGNGFDKDLGLKLTFAEYAKSGHCLASQFNLCKFDLENWSDYERSLRKLIVNWDGSDLKAEEINKNWQAFCKYFSAFFTEVFDEYIPNINISEKCAYKLLKSLNQDSKVFTFNYTNPYEFLNITESCNFNFVHGRYYQDTFKKSMAVMLQSFNMIIGIDNNRINEAVKQHKCLRPLIKKYNSHFVDTGIEKELNNAETVIFFGLSLGITDSDYFDNFFLNILNNKSICKRIFIVTYDEDSFYAIKESTREWSIDLSKIREHGTKLIPIYTKDGTENLEFKKMLRFITGRI